MTKMADKKLLAAFCRRHRIVKMALFGSALSDEFNEDSDIDLLVDFEPGHVPGFFRLVELEEELSALFHDRKVDLRTLQDLSRYFRDEIARNAEVQYARS